MLRDGSGDLITGVYGHLETENKAKTGQLLKSLYYENELPWLCGGDFNLMMWSTEKQGGADFRFDEAVLFREACDYCKLEDLNFVGVPFHLDKQPRWGKQSTRTVRSFYSKLELESKMCRGFCLAPKEKAFRSLAYTVEHA